MSDSMYAGQILSFIGENVVRNQRNAKKTIDRHVTIQGDNIVSHAQFKCCTVPHVSVGPKMADIGNTLVHTWELFIRRTRC